MPYEEVVEGDYVWVGTPEEIAGRVAAIRDLCPGLTEVAIVANAGGADHWKAIKAQELFAEHVIPAVRDRRPGRDVTATAPSSDGCGIAYDDLGSGEPALLFMTGWCSSRARWGEVAARCGKGRRVLNFEWRGHGDSSAAPGDFGTEEMVQDAVAAVEHAGVGSFVPCAASHSGWVALELRRRLPERVPKLVSVDWLVTEPSERYLDVVRQLQSPETWRGGRSTLFRIWAAGDESPPIRAALGVMGEQDEDMWMRSGRVIEGCYAEAGSPLEAWSALEHPPPVLHLYGQPPDPAYLAAQLEFAALHPWFTVQTVPARTHFAMIDSPRTVADAIERFVAA